MRHFSCHRYWPVLMSTVTALLLSAASARADLIITPTFDSSITGNPNATIIENTIDTAIQQYEARYANDIDVTIDFEAMSSGLGQSQTTLYAIPYTDFYSAFAAEVALDPRPDTSEALSELPDTIDNPVTGTPNLALSTANARALGICTVATCPATYTDGYDGIIGLNLNLLNLSPTGTQNPSDYSLQAVAEHEMDEVLGLGSGLNLPTDNLSMEYPRPEDLYRYSANGVRSYTNSSSAVSYFSINGGATNLIGFNQQGNGRADYGDWASSATPHVQDAYGTPGSTLGVEFTALDVIGYQTVPEPATGTVVPGALAALAAAAFLRRSFRRA